MHKPAMHLPGRPNLGLTLNTPAALSGGGSYGLPPYAPRAAHEVDAYPTAPKTWMRSSKGNRSYFSPVREGLGMWLDFNSCWDHDHDVAVVISVQGINPVTGMKCVGSKPKLEQYLDKCPKHDVKFKDGRVCPNCGYGWTKQNYLATTGTPAGMMWIDGFRGEDGVVRQYLFTADSARGVAAQLIGEDRVFAIGIAFYLSKKKHPERLRSAPNNLKIGGTIPQYYKNLNNFNGPPGVKTWITDHSSGSGGAYDAYFGATVSNGPTLGNTVYLNNASVVPSGVEGVKGPTGKIGTSVNKSLVSAPNNQLFAMAASNTLMRSVRGKGLSVNMTSLDDAVIAPSEVEVKKLEIAAGAKIEQKIHDDPNGLDYWEDEPTGIIYLNYCDEEACNLILETKKVGTPASDTFMAGLKVGN